MSRISLRIAIIALAVSGASLLAAAPASATSFCYVRATADGFVALRTGPSATARLVGRMKPKDEVLIGLGEKGNWIEVTWWRGDDRLTKGYDRKAGHGWVHKKLIEEECG